MSDSEMLIWPFCTADSHPRTINQNVLRGFEITDEVTKIKRWVGCTRGHDWKLFKNYVNLDAGKI